MMRNIKLCVLFFARSIGLFRLFRRFTRSEIRILCYHGGTIGDEHRFNPLLFCSGTLLGARLRWLANNGFVIVPLSEAVAMLKRGARRPSLPTVLTFDDGWYSTYRELHPVVRAQNVPATLYLCTKFLVDGWPNIEVALAYILWKTDHRSASIQEKGSTTAVSYDISSKDGKQRFAADSGRSLQRDCSDRAAVCRELESLALQLGLSASDLNLASRRFDSVTRDELATLAAQGWSVEMHGHVHRYPAGNPEGLKADLARCKKEIRRSGLPESRHYCYPSGDFDDAAHGLLERLGVDSATTTRPGLLRAANRKQLFYLPRFLDGENIHPLEFESEMSGFADFVRRMAGKA